MLLPCPFCGHADIRIIYEKPLHKACCSSCHALGQPSRYASIAEKNWNHRENVFLDKSLEI